MQEVKILFRECRTATKEEAFKGGVTMVTQEMIDRINTLYHKSQATGLTEEEKAEQAELRKKYIEAIRTSMRSNLNNISIKEKDGTITDLGKKYGGVKSE